MRNQQVILKDEKSFDLFISFEKIENPLGAVRATLKAYTLSEAAAGAEAKVYKLYKTKEGNWYDHPSTDNPNPLLMMMLKAAINKVEMKK